jgi:hypothetical protein
VIKAIQLFNHWPTPNNKVKVSIYAYAHPEGVILLTCMNLFVEQQCYLLAQTMKIELAKSIYLAELPEILCEE